MHDLPAGRFRVLRDCVVFPACTRRATDADSTIPHAGGGFLHDYSGGLPVTAKPDGNLRFLLRGMQYLDKRLNTSLGRSHESQA